VGGDPDKIALGLALGESVRGQGAERMIAALYDRKSTEQFAAAP
jgi:hypothetical protein